MKQSDFASEFDPSDVPTVLGTPMENAAVATQIAAKGAEKAENLDEMLRVADYVSIHCPYTKETTDMISARQLGLMQKHAYLVTTARGGIHNEDALADALEKKQIAGAGHGIPYDRPDRVAAAVKSFSGI